MPDGLRVGFVPGVTLTKWRTIWAKRFPRIPLEAVEVAVDDQRRVLDADEVDMCFVRLPVDLDGLHAIRLYEEVPVAWLAKDHPLAELDELTNDDLVGEELLTRADEHNLDLVALAGAVLVVPKSVARTQSRRDLVYRPVTDAPTTTIALAWLQSNEQTAIDEFIGVVRGRTENSSRTTQARTSPGADAMRVKPAAPERKPARTSAKAPRRGPAQGKSRKPREE